VSPDALTFDFTWNEALGVEKVAEIERLVNETIARALPVFTMNSSLAPAREVRGLRQMFGEQYVTSCPGKRCNLRCWVMC
jgi:alanyl-tRNA synthetase